MITKVEKCKTIEGCGVFVMDKTSETSCRYSNQEELKTEDEAIACMKGTKVLSDNHIVEFTDLEGHSA